MLNPSQHYYAAAAGNLNSSNTLCYSRDQCRLCSAAAAPAATWAAARAAAAAVAADRPPVQGP